MTIKTIIKLTVMRLSLYVIITFLMLAIPTFCIFLLSLNVKAEQREHIKVNDEWVLDIVLVDNAVCFMTKDYTEHCTIYSSEKKALKAFNEAKENFKLNNQ